MTQRMSVAGLGAVPETLLIPLAARAMARQAFPRTGFVDPLAEHIAANLDTDLTRFSADRGSMYVSILRAQWFDRAAKRFLSQHPEGLCVSLGAGLDARAQRVGLASYPDAAWIDLDLPEVQALRAQLIPDTAQIKSQIGDATTPDDWIGILPWPQNRPSLVLIEGVIMYLPRAKVDALVLALCTAASQRQAPLMLALDYASPFMMRMYRHHPSVKKTRAAFHSSLRRPQDLESASSGLRCVEHKDVSAAAGAAGAIMSMTHRLLTFGRSIHGCALYQYQEPNRLRNYEGAPSTSL